jgi:hypothetical protein
MKNLNNKTDAQKSWEKEMVIATEIMGKAEQQGADVLDFGDTNFLNYVQLKRSFHDQAEDMVKWITVFGDLKEAIQNNADYDVYEIVQKWDMWYHS